jgi:hypothetical protein
MDQHAEDIETMWRTIDASGWRTGSQLETVAREAFERILAAIDPPEPPEPVIITIDLVRPDGALLMRQTSPLYADGGVERTVNELHEIRGPYTIRVMRHTSPTSASPS